VLTQLSFPVSALRPQVHVVALRQKHLFLRRRRWPGMDHRSIVTRRLARLQPPLLYTACLSYSTCRLDNALVSNADCHDGIVVP
jgi:hypothetical protein